MYRNNPLSEQGSLQNASVSTAQFTPVLLTEKQMSGRV